jgi:cytochrome P450
MGDHFDLNNRAVIQNPFPLLAEMRRDAPVHWNRSVKGWFLTRYRDVRMVMRDPRFSVEKMAPFAGRAAPPMRDKIAFLAEILGGWMVFMDPPGHTRLREVLQSAFMPRTLAQLRPRVAAVANDLLDAVGARAEMDLIADFAYPLPATVIGDLCGVPREKSAQIESWSADIAKFVLQGRATPDKYDRTYRALRDCVDYYHELVAEHRRHPRENLTGRLIDGGDSGHRLSDDEIVSTLILLLFAGHETTTNLIANGMLALLRQPDQMALLEANRELIPSAVEEFLRFNGPVATVVRIATEDVEIGGQTIKAGDRVFASVEAAGRDPEIFANPETVDIARRRNAHITFGKGIHLCIGAPLARLQGQVAFEALLGRYCAFELQSPDLDWRDELITRGLNTLPISFRHR